MIDGYFNSDFLNGFEYSKTIPLNPLGGLVCFEIAILQGSAKLEILHNEVEIATSFDSENDNYFLAKSEKQFIKEVCNDRFLRFYLESSQYVNINKGTQLVWAFYDDKRHTKNPNFEIKVTTKENTKGFFKQIL